MNKELLDALLDAPYVPSEHHAPWLSWCRRMVEKYPAALPQYKNEDPLPLNPYAFLDFLFSILTPQDRIVCSNGSACVMTLQAAKIKLGQRLFTNSGCAAMGYGLPAAIGVATADRSHRTLCIEGDGSIMMNLQELATVAHRQLNIKIILLNNGGYHSIRQTQHHFFEGRFVGLDAQSGLGFPDFALVAKAFGIAYLCIESENELGKLSDALRGCGGRTQGHRHRKSRLCRCRYGRNVRHSGSG